jgi:hypothetical protein
MTYLLRDWNGLELPAGMRMPMLRGLLPAKEPRSIVVREPIGPVACGTFPALAAPVSPGLPPTAPAPR